MRRICELLAPCSMRSQDLVANLPFVGVCGCAPSRVRPIGDRSTSANRQAHFRALWWTKFANRHLTYSTAMRDW